MKKFAIFAAAAVALASCCGSGRDTHLPKAADYRQNDSGVVKMLQHIRRLQGTGELNSVMVLKDGKKVVEYYDVCYGPEFLNICWSVSKTFTATAIGFAVQDGLLSLEDKLVDHLKPEQIPAHISDTLAELNLYNLIRMSSGLKIDPIGKVGSKEVESPVRYTLEQGFMFKPGERFKYNSLNTYMLSAVLTNVTGMKVEDYLKVKLFEPLGIRNWHWDSSPEGYNMGGWGLYITTESLAKMGQFFLQKGMWNGKQLLNSEWIEQAMSPQIYQNDKKDTGDEWSQGYGYQMWVCTHGGARLDGAHGQYSVILPNENAVIVITGNCNRTHDEFVGIWDYLYPIVK